MTSDSCENAGSLSRQRRFCGNDEDVVLDVFNMLNKKWPDLSSDGTSECRPGRVYHTLSMAPVVASGGIHTKEPLYWYGEWMIYPPRSKLHMFSENWSMIRKKQRLVH